MPHRTLLVTTLGLCLAVGVVGSAAPAQAATKAELQERLKAREPDLRVEKNAGRIGEVWNGLVEIVKPEASDARLASLVAAENADRRAVYQLLAAETKATPDQVAERAARRNFDQAQTGEWLKFRDGKWRQNE